MALIGSGTSQVKNFATAASLSSADMDESLAAFVEQIGGVKWLNGASARCAGNLTYDNFASGPSLPNWVKKEHRSLYTVSFDIKVERTALSFPMHLGAFKAHYDCVIANWDVIVESGAPVTAQPVVKLYVNGSVALTGTAVAGSGVDAKMTQSPGISVGAGSIVAVSILSMTTTGTKVSASSVISLYGDHL